MRIGVDAREILGNKTGVGVYLGELLRRWTARPDAGSRCFVLFAPASIDFDAPPGTIERCIVGAGKAAGTWWEQTSLRRGVPGQSLNVFFAPAYTAPMTLPVPLALTIHDVSFLAHPEWSRPRERWRRRLITRRAASLASVVLTDSMFSRSEIERHLHLDPQKIRVVPPGITRRDVDTTSASREPLVLYVGSLFNRRRLPQLIGAFARATLNVPQARLVIVGADRTWPREDLAVAASAHEVSDRVECRSYVTDGELAQLYARATAFAFLSEYEGFGLTPLEALAAGVPIVVLDTPVAREVYGPAAFYVASDDDGTMTAEVLRRLLTTRAAADKIMRHAPTVLARYSWDRAADDTLSEIERIAVPVA
jgi:glycosyltransferase involved in cell wall biosynthesis